MSTRGTIALSFSRSDPERVSSDCRSLLAVATTVHYSLNAALTTEGRELHRHTQMNQKGEREKKGKKKRKSDSDTHDRS